MLPFFCLLIIRTGWGAQGAFFAYNGSMTLPLPSPDALALSAALKQKIAAAIAASGGWMPFARYMEMALYEPGLGYYDCSAARIMAV